jgi:predicted phage terminase large subunit-like protein
MKSVLNKSQAVAAKKVLKRRSRNLRGFKVFADRVTGSKEVRAEPFAAQVQGGNVSLVAGMYQADLLDEMISFPNGKYCDQVDACSGAFNRLVAASTYNLDALAS